MPDVIELPAVTPVALPRIDSGTYQLIILLEEPRTLAIGALGTFSFSAGTYVYTGRSSRYLRQRLERHIRSKKTLRWHIDYLLRAATVGSIRVYPGRAEDECPINLETAAQGGYSFPIPGFGSSGCRCPAHLILVGQQ